MLYTTRLLSYLAFIQKKIQLAGANTGAEELHISILANTSEHSDRIADSVRSFAPDASITEWENPVDLVCSVRQTDVDLLYIDAARDGAIRAVEYISSEMPSTAIVFMAGDSSYTMDALRVHAQGYLTEPISRDGLRSQYDYYLQRKAAFADNTSDDLSHNSRTECRIEFRKDGGFDCLKDGVPVHFNRSKTRDLLEYLAGKDGAMADDKELLKALWGNENESNKSYLRIIKAEIVKLFKDAGCEDAIVKHRGRIGIMMEKIS